MSKLKDSKGLLLVSYFVNITYHKGEQHKYGWMDRTFHLRNSKLSSHPTWSVATHTLLSNCPITDLQRPPLEMRRNLSIYIIQVPGLPAEICQPGCHLVPVVVAL